MDSIPSGLHIHPTSQSGSIKLSWWSLQCRRRRATTMHRETAMWF